MTQPSFLAWLKSALLGIATVEDNAPPQAPSAPPPSAPAPMIEDEDDPRVPKTAMTRVATIHEMLDDLKARATAKGDLIQERIELEQIQATHLPRLLKSYVEIPPQHRAEIFRSTGRSASYMLIERLDRIIERLAEISRMLAQDDLDAFASNIRFIDTRYGATGSASDWE